jgi:hypothetical protein
MPCGGGSGGGRAKAALMNATAWPLMAMLQSAFIRVDVGGYLPQAVALQSARKPLAAGRHRCHRCTVLTIAQQKELKNLRAYCQQEPKATRTFYVAWRIPWQGRKRSGRSEKSGNPSAPIKRNAGECGASADADTADRYGQS